VQLSLERGANPNLRTESLTPLLMAAADPDPAFLEHLLEHGADRTARGAGGSTALSQAASGGPYPASAGRCWAAAEPQPWVS